MTQVYPGCTDGPATVRSACLQRPRVTNRAERTELSQRSHKRSGRSPSGEFGPDALGGMSHAPGRRPVSPATIGHSFQCELSQNFDERLPRSTLGGGLEVSGREGQG